MAISNDVWEKRILCSDGNCIGIIGADGRCNECGKPYEGALPDFEIPADAVDVEQTDPDQQTDPPPASTDGEPPNDRQPPDDDDDWDNRTLCVDESCIGVVGPDGRCNECGKPYPK